MLRIAQKHHAAWPVHDRSAVRVCNLAGISFAKENIITLRNLRNGLNLSISEIEAQKKQEDLATNVLLLLRFTKASCDAFIGLAASFSAILPSGDKKTKLVKSVYGMSTAIADASGNAIAGNSIDLVKTSSSIVKSGADLITDKGISSVVKTRAIDVNIVNAAMNEDKKGLKKSAIEYVNELTKLSLDVLNAKKSKLFVGIAKESFDYKEQLNSAFDEALGNKTESTERYIALRNTLLRSARLFEKKISEMESFLESCDTVEESLSSIKMSPMG